MSAPQEARPASTDQDVTEADVQAHLKFVRGLRLDDPLTEKVIKRGKTITAVKGPGEKWTIEER